jgi:SAM-dependent methyltransferase
MMSTTSLPSTGAGTFRHIIQQAKWRLLTAYDSYHDRRLNIDASGLIDPAELQHSGSSASQSYVYLGTPHSVLDLALKRLPIEHERFTFIDIGSGLGRVVARAAEYPFAKVEGVELSDRLQAPAHENIRKASSAGKLKAQVHLLHQDILTYDFDGNPLVVFFFNCFKRPVLEAFLRNLEASLAATPRPCYFVYLNPRNGDCVTEVTRMKERPLPLRTKAAVRLFSPWPLKIYGCEG